MKWVYVQDEQPDIYTVNTLPGNDSQIVFENNGKENTPRFDNDLTDGFP